MKDIKLYNTLKNGVKVVQFLILLFFTFHFVPFIFITPAYADGQTLRVSPVIINVDLSPGKTYKHDITIENLSNIPLPLRASLNDFVTGSEEGGYIFKDSKTNPLLTWIKLDNTDFLLNPKEKKTITMTITTPTKISLGGYYGVLFFEPVLQKTLQDTTQVNAKVGVLMLANIGVTDPNAKKAEIVAFSTGQFHEDGNVPLLLRVKNTSLNFFTAKPVLTVTPLLSLKNKARSVTLENKIIFPGAIRRWTEEPVMQDLSPNIYRATIAVSSGNGQVVTDEKYFIVFPLTYTIVLGAVILVLIYMVVKRGRVRKALKVLFNS